ncbi:MAG: hypothetical protein IKT50_02295 [Clostridia bacterium]|nr:hypothetical protein [Clostridia bacterium]
MKDFLIFPHSCSTNTAKIVAEDEKNYFDQIKKAAKLIVEMNVRFVFLAGPSCSGKTTTALTLVNDLESLGKRAKTFSTDDFFFNQSLAKRNEDGIPDYDAFSHTDSRYLISVLQDLSQGKRTQLPVFDFHRGVRSENTVPLSPEDYDVFIIEGIHGLNDAILSQMSDPYLGLYLTVTKGLKMEGSDVFLPSEDLRFCRRLIRDFKHRNASAEKTFQLWKQVLRSEKDILHPFQKNAALTLNSNFRYEIAVEQEEVTSLLGGVEKDSPFFEDAKRLLEALSAFPVFSEDIVPKNSVLQEFIN